MSNLFFVPDTHLDKPLNVDDKEFMLIKAGETKLSHFKGSHDGYLFEWNDDCGMTLFVILNNVTSDELESIVDTGRAFEIAFSEINDCGFISVKFGNMPWGEGSFEPLLYDFLDMPYCDDYDTQGMALTICVVDPSKDCLVMGNRIIGLGHDFSVKFSDWAHRRYSDKKARNTFTRNRHYENINRTFQEFTSNELQSRAKIRWKIAGESSPKERNAINIEENREK